MSDEAKTYLAKVATQTSLRYAIHLITVASLVAAKRKASEIAVEDVKKVYGLFVDVKRSTDFLTQYQKQMMFHTIEDDDVCIRSSRPRSLRVPE
jgi:RuvB-like protein 2